MDEQDAQRILHLSMIQRFREADTIHYLKKELTCGPQHVNHNKLDQYKMCLKQPAFDKLTLVFLPLQLEKLGVAKWKF